LPTFPIKRITQSFDDSGFENWLINQSPIIIFLNMPEFAKEFSGQIRAYLSFLANLWPISGNLALIT
jgi:hypothetical protein